MLRSITKCLLFSVMALTGNMFFMIKDALAQSDDRMQPLVASMQQAQDGMTLWQLVQAGGIVMIVLGVLSLVAVAMIIYYAIALKPNSLAPKAFADDIVQSLEEGKYRVVQVKCQSRQNIIAQVVMAGMDKRRKGIIYMREAMEMTARQSVGDLWQKISYLADIAAIAPLIGLLGTVIGMIQAFNVIAFQTAVVKPVVLAGGVSKAMVTTAGGLIVAIPVMIFYSYFRGRVQETTNIVESYSNEIIKIIDEAYTQEMEEA